MRKRKAFSQIELPILVLFISGNFYIYGSYSFLRGFYPIFKFLYVYDTLIFRKYKFCKVILKTKERLFFLNDSIIWNMNVTRFITYNYPNCSTDSLPKIYSYSKWVKYSSSKNLIYSLRLIFHDSTGWLLPFSSKC